jgi:tetratricopeptide (TPR) repeat protein
MKNIENEIKIILNLFNASKFDLVISKSKKLIRKFPEYVVLYNVLGSAYQNTGNFILAKNIFIKGVKMDPTNIAIMNNLANVYKNIGEVELSESLFKKIINMKPDYINAYINLGNLKRDNNDFEMAIDLYKKALAINDKIAVIHYSLALAYQGLGEFKLAIDYAKKTLLIDPKLTQADMLISQSIKYEIDDEHFIKMDSKFKNLELNNEQKVNLLFALAKANEDMNQINKSFECLNQGNLMKRKSLNYNINKEIKFFNEIKEAFTKVDLSKISKKQNSRKKIIFILGMPRSGTSLVEQIITSHTNVFGGGELPQLSKIVKDRLMVGDSISNEKVKKLIDDEEFADLLRKDYFDYLKRFNANETFITDKAPLNFRWIGLIKILFPDSKIIHCSRNPRDNCLSLYKNFFEGGLNFSYDQKELGTYYNLYLDLIKFWDEEFPNSIYLAKYEQIVKNQQNEIKKIIDFCDLPWEEGCLSFHKNKTPIKTMSTAQARQPIYKGSINSFEKYSSYLNELNKII